MNTNNVVDVTFVSVWDGGFEVRTDAKYDQYTKKVFDIEVYEGAADMVSNLDGEYIEFENGERKETYEGDDGYQTD